MSNLSELLPAGAGAKSTEFVASGTLGSGVTVALNSDGTISVIQETPVAQSKTSAFQATTNAAEINGSAYAPNLNLIVLSYRDGSTTYPTTVAGSISGSTITFGTPYVINSYSGEAVRVSYYPATPYFWYSYKNTGNQVLDRYLSISGTTFSQWGGVYSAISQSVGDVSTFIMDVASCHVVYSDTSTSTGLVRHGYVGYQRTNWISSGLVTFSSTQIRGVSSAQNDSSSQYVLTYSEPVNSNRGMAVVGTMTNPSGPSQTLSFGTPQTFTSDDAYYPTIAYSTADDKYVIAYTNNSNSSYGYAVVATVSGSSISFGTPVVIKSSASYGFALTYDSDLNEIIIVFRDNPASLRTKLVRATISGTSLTFSSFFDITTFYAPYTTVQYDTVDNKTVISYRNPNNSDRAESVLHQSPYSPTNSADFVGITDQAIADTATGAVIVEGGVSDKVTGLTTGSDYYVQPDGSISTTESSAPAGRALSSNSILLEG